MNSYRLSHIQQLWAELREQIRSLQSSIWENTTLASNAWHRSSFEAITEMLSRMTHGDGDRPTSASGDNANISANRHSGLQMDSLYRTNSSHSNSAFTSNSSFQDGSLFQRMSQSSGLGQNACIPGSSSQYLPFSANRTETSSTTTSAALYRVNGASDSSNSSALRTAVGLNLRGNPSRRPNQPRRLFNFRHQNSLVRRLGTTAGVLRASRTSCRSTQQSFTTSTRNNLESSQQSSQPPSAGQHFLHERLSLMESVHSGQTEVAIAAGNESDVEPRETPLERYKPSFFSFLQ